MSGDYEYKQVILVRKDLNMRRGKSEAQVAHASMAAILPNMDHPSVIAWLSSRFAKISLSVDSEEELNSLLQKAKEKNLLTSKIIDSGFTEFNGIPTLTCGAIGPAKVEDFIGLTDHLKLR